MEKILREVREKSKKEETLKAANILYKLNRLSAIHFDRISEADAALSTLKDLVVLYGKATVGDLWDILGIERDNDSTEEIYGWRNLNDGVIVSTNDYYILRLPNAIYLEGDDDEDKI